jgi:hypothetical protein
MSIFPLFPHGLAMLAAVLVLPWGAAAASDREWSRVGRIVELRGDVAFYDPDRDEWTEALRNRPVTEGDRLVLARGARAEIRIAGATLLLAQGTDLEVLALDDDRIRLELNKGSIALAIPSRALAEQTEIRTREIRLRPQHAGRYRIDREEDSTFAAALRGDLEASGPSHLLLIGSGERYEIWLDERRAGARSRPARMPDDRLTAWADEAFRADERRAEAWRYASPDIPGVEDLDRHGRWDTHPEYGAVWFPAVSAGWQPFRDGRWIWMQPWGWTWVDAQPWGFAPSHYGRWVQWRGRWGWWPGHRHARPVFAPALVAWVGGPSVSIGITIGHAPPAAWVPLAPYQPYVPIVQPRPPPPRPPKYPPQVPTGPISKPPPPVYGSQGVPVGVQQSPAARPLQPMQPVPPAPVAAPPAEPHGGKSAAPFSAPPQTPAKGEKPEKPEKADKPDKRDGRADQRRREQTQ